MNSGFLIRFSNLLEEHTVLQMCKLYVTDVLNCQSYFSVSIIAIIIFKFIGYKYNMLLFSLIKMPNQLFTSIFELKR